MFQTHHDVKFKVFRRIGQNQNYVQRNFRQIQLSFFGIFSDKEINTKPERSPSVIRESATEAVESNVSAANSNVSATAGLRTRTVPILGPDFKEIRIQDEALKNKVYYLVSGHGGPDPGTIYRGQNMMLCEDEYAYDVTLRLARKLMEHSATVHMIVQDPNDGIRNEMYLSCR